LGKLVKNLIFGAWDRSFPPPRLHWRYWACSFLQACLTTSYGYLLQTPPMDR